MTTFNGGAYDAWHLSSTALSLDDVSRGGHAIANA